MTYDNILKELCSLIQNSLSPAPAKTIPIGFIMNFLLGEKIDDKTKTIANTEVEVDVLRWDSLIKIYKGDRNLSIELLRLLALSTDWSLTRLKNCILSDNISSETLKTQLTNLYIHYFPNSLDISIEWMFRSLVRLYFWHTDEIDNFFIPYHKSQCNNFILWSEKYAEFKELLDHSRHKAIFITGLPGTGKTEFIKHYIQDNSINPYKIAWLDINCEAIPLAQRIQNISFLCYDEMTFNETLEILKEMDESSWLVIDIPYIKREDWVFLRQNLFSLPLQIIITTRTFNIPTDCLELNLDHMPENYLQELFCKNVPCDFFSSVEYSTLWKIIDYNPYVTVLLSQLIKCSPTLPKDILLSEKEWIWNQTGLKKIHSLYKDNGQKSGLSIKTLIYRMLSEYPTNFSKSKFYFLSELSLWTKSGITRQELALIFPVRDIDIAFDAGILQYNDSNKTNLYMPSLIADTIWYQHPIVYKDYEPEMMYFLHSMQTGEELIFSYSTMYQHVLNMVFRFHFQITHMHSRITKTAKEQFITWNNLLTKIIHSYIDLGQHKIAMDILPYLYIYQTKKEPTPPFLKPLHEYIRELIGYRIKLRKHTANPLATIDEFLSFLKHISVSETLGKIKKQSEKDIFMQHFFAFLNDTTDYFIRLERTITLDIIILPSSKKQKYLYPILEVLRLLIELYGSTFNRTPDYVYYYITYYCITSIYIDSNHLYITNEIFERMQNMYPENKELLFKAQLQKFYYLLIQLCRKPFNYHEDAISVENEYITLQNIFSGKIWSWDTTWLYYSCILLMRLYYMPLCGYPLTEEKLEECDKMLSFAKDQMSLEADHFEAFKNCIDRIKQASSQDTEKTVK